MESNYEHGDTPCDVCGVTVNEKHHYDAEGNCYVCGFNAIVTKDQLDTAIESGVGSTPDNPLIIGDGTYTSTFIVEDKNLVIKDGVFDSGIDMYLNNSNVTIDGGRFDLFYIWAAHNGTTITITDGEFTADEFIQPNDGKFTLKIKGGTFEWKSISSSANDTTIEITGGAFKFDVSRYVVDGYYVVYDEETGYYSVV